MAAYLVWKWEFGPLNIERSRHFFTKLISIDQKIISIDLKMNSIDLKQILIVFACHFSLQHASFVDISKTGNEVQQLKRRGPENQNEAAG